MKQVTKTITIYLYTILKVDISSGAMEVVNEFERAEPMSKHEALYYSDNGYVVIRDEQREKFSIPVTAFIHACREYANNITMEDNNG